MLFNSVSSPALSGGSHGGDNVPTIGLEVFCGHRANARKCTSDQNGFHGIPLFGVELQHVLDAKTRHQIVSHVVE